MKTQTQLTSGNLSHEIYAPRILAVILLAILLLLALTGCQNEPPSQTADASLDPTGVYQLMAVDGKTVPCDLSHAGAALTIKSGTFTITPDGNCRSDITFSVPTRGDMNKETKATYKRQGAELTLRWQGAGMTTGIINGRDFTMNNEGMVFAYRK